MKEKIYLAGGCFWGIQAYYDMLDGVLCTKVGYANSLVSAPSYHTVCSGATNATEAVLVEYDSSILSLEHILWRFFAVVDASALNYQGNDVGTQYRNGIYFEREQYLGFVQHFIEQYIAPLYTEQVVTEVKKIENFYEAEEYHQKYLHKNKNGYCHINITDALMPIEEVINRFSKKPK